MDIQQIFLVFCIFISVCGIAYEIRKAKKQNEQDDFFVKRYGKSEEQNQ